MELSQGHPSSKVLAVVWTQRCYARHLYMNSISYLIELRRVKYCWNIWRLRKWLLIWWRSLWVECYAISATDRCYSVLHLATWAHDVLYEVYWKDRPPMARDAYLSVCICKECSGANGGGYFTGVYGDHHYSLLNDDKSCIALLK